MFYYRRMPLERLTDRVVIVTGAASGIGRATATRVAAEGANVLACDVTPDLLAEAVEEANKTAAGGEVVGRVVDVSDEQQTADAIADAVGRWGRIDGLVAEMDRICVDLVERVAQRGGAAPARPTSHANGVATPASPAKPAVAASA